MGLCESTWSDSIDDCPKSFLTNRSCDTTRTTDLWEISPPPHMNEYDINYNCNQQQHTSFGSIDRSQIDRIEAMSKFRQETINDLSNEPPYIQFDKITFYQNKMQNYVKPYHSIPFGLSKQDQENPMHVVIVFSGDDADEDVLTEFFSEGISVSYVEKSIWKPALMDRGYITRRFSLFEHLFEGPIEYSINLNIPVCCQTIAKWIKQRNKYEYDMINNNCVDYALYFAKKCGINRQLLLNKFFLNIIIKVRDICRDSSRATVAHVLDYVGYNKWSTSKDRAKTRVGLSRVATESRYHCTIDVNDVGLTQKNTNTNRNTTIIDRNTFENVNTDLGVTDHVNVIRAIPSSPSSPSSLLNDKIETHMHVTANIQATGKKREFNEIGAETSMDNKNVGLSKQNIKNTNINSK